MAETPLPVVVAVTEDLAVLRSLETACRALGARVQLADNLDEPPGDAVAWCLDEAHPRCSPAGVERLRARGTPAAVVWLARTPRGPAAEQALAAGADDVLAVPAWQPEARARLGRLLPAARARGSRGFRSLLRAQARLIPLGTPEEVARSAEAAFAEILPGAAVGVTVCTDDDPGAGARPPEVEWGGPGGWTRAVLPLDLGAQRFGAVELQAPPGAAYPPEKLDQARICAAQTAQALHRSRLYRDLSQGKAEWERTFDALADPISIVGPGLRIRRLNRALARLRGAEPRELVGQPCYRALRGRRSPCPDCPVQAALETGGTVHREAVPVDSRRTFDYHVYPLRDEAGTVCGAVTYARDVTRDQQLARSLRQSEKLMSLGQIAAGIAHEINNPLTAISSYAQLLALRVEDPKGAESARRIQQGVDKIHRLVRNLTSFARPSDEGFYPLELNDIVTDTLTFSRYEVTRGETELVEQLDRALPKVLGSKDQLEQLLVILLTNARDAVAGRGTVTVTTRVEGAEAVLEVADDGVGIASADLDQIFEPFYTTKPVGQGTGLGLFIAAGIAKAHGGKLSVLSEPGRGTRVRLALPAFAP
ncbi:MAG: hypothetical protein Kow0092_12900 [Deferrisomatales bacterium]